MNGETVERRIGSVAGVALYALAAGMLFVIAVNAVTLTIWPSPPFPQGGFPVSATRGDCEEASGKWQGAELAMEGGYCVSQAEQVRNVQVDRYTLAARVVGVAAGAVALLAAVWLTVAGTLVRFGVAAGAVMALASVSGVPLLFMTISSQSSAYLLYAGSGAIPVPRWEAVVAVVAWLAVLLVGYTKSRKPDGTT